MKFSCHLCEKKKVFILLLMVHPASNMSKIGNSDFKMVGDVTNFGASLDIIHSLKGHWCNMFPANSLKEKVIL